jgi:tetratricopeptide (TPR) repeat protein
MSRYTGLYYPWPLWDTFEALFFLFAGIFIGIVLGVLFPSLGRTLRRKMKTYKHLTADISHLSYSLQPYVSLLHTDPLHITSHQIDVPERFVLARYLFQARNPHEALKIYTDILTHSKSSSLDVQQALFEMAQVYASLNLYTKSFDVAFELLHHIPQNRSVFEFLIDITLDPSLFDKMSSIASCYKGSWDLDLKLLTTHALCTAGEWYQNNKLPNKALEYARKALRYSPTSGRAKILLWQLTSLNLWKKSLEAADTSMISQAWLTDLEARSVIYKDTGISPAAGSHHLFNIIKNLRDIASPLPLLQQAKEDSPLSSSVNIWEDFVFYGALGFLKEQENITEHLKEFLSQISLFFFQNSLLLQNKNALLTKALYAGLLAHTCSRCNSIVSEFLWRCPHCKSLETLKPYAADQRRISCLPALEPLHDPLP